MGPIDTAQVLVDYERELKKHRMYNLRISPLAGQLKVSSKGTVFIYFPYGTKRTLANSMKEWNEVKMLLLSNAT